MVKNIEELSKRLLRLEDLEAIKALKARYAEALDDRYDADVLSSLFSETGNWVVINGVAEGRDGVRKLCETCAAEVPWSYHGVSPGTIEIDSSGTSATGNFFLVCYQTMKNSAGEFADFLLVGSYQDKFVKVDGKWYFDEIRANITKTTQIQKT